jgi:toxin ParE1/3/4
MTHVVYSPRARRDILGVLEYIAREDPGVAAAFVTRLEHHCSLLAGTPQMGRERPDVGPGVRSLVEGSYLIFYKFNRDTDRVNILRVWHGRRRLPRLGG